MSFIASMVAASAASAGLVTAGGIGATALGAAATGAAGAGLGAGISALTGGDPGQGALMGGISGLASGAIGALGPAFEGGDVAAQVGEKAVEQGTEQAAQQTVQQTVQQATQEGINQTAQQAVQQGAGQVAQESVGQVAQGGVSSLPQPIAQGNGVVTQGLGAQTPPPMAHPLPGSQPLNVLAEAPQNSDVLLNGSTGPGWGESLTGNKIGGQALENAVYGAGINGLMAGAQGQDVGKGMLKGAVAGGVGGAAAGGLGQMGGTIGEFATAHPMITSGGIGAITNAALNSAMPDGSEMLLPNSPGLKSNFRFNPNIYRAYLPHGNSFGSYAAGGITDLDNYDAAPNQPTTADPGTLNIPNRAEVANNEGYVGNSVKLMAHGGISDLGSYSDGGRLLKGPGDGISDDIPATIEGRQPARLAANEFVIPARIVSEIGNGSTDAGAKALYAMMDRVQKDRKKSIGKGKFAVDSKAARHLDTL